MFSTPCIGNTQGARQTSNLSWDQDCSRTPPPTKAPTPRPTPMPTPVSIFFLTHDMKDVNNTNNSIIHFEHY